MIDDAALHVVSQHAKHNWTVALQLKGRLVDNVIWARDETPNYLSASAPIRLIIFKFLATNTSNYFIKGQLTPRIVEANRPKLQWIL